MYEYILVLLIVSSVIVGSICVCGSAGACDSVHTALVAENMTHKPKRTSLEQHSREQTEKLGTDKTEKLGRDKSGTACIHGVPHGTMCVCCITAQMGAEDGMATCGRTITDKCSVPKFFGSKCDCGHYCTTYV
tara:strand:+ start:316 stop:714 length:399 start_codon:yes stop_codon:yes gene_type:complete